MPNGSTFLRLTHTKEFTLCSGCKSHPPNSFLQETEFYFLRQCIFHSEPPSYRMGGVTTALTEALPAQCPKIVPKCASSAPPFMEVTCCKGVYSGLALPGHFRAMFGTRESLPSCTLHSHFFLGSCFSLSPTAKKQWTGPLNSQGP